MVGEQTWILLANVLWSRSVGWVRNLTVSCVTIVIAARATVVGRGSMVHLVMVLVHHVVVLRMVHVIVSVV